MQLPILSGIYASTAPDLRTAYPVNMMPVPKQSGVSTGFLRPAEGIVEFTTGPGLDRGGIVWQDVMYRVMGQKLVKIDPLGTVEEIGDIPGTDRVSMDYSFDRLAIAADRTLFYSNGGTVTPVTDPDLGVVLDVVWVDGYFMTTDGNALVVTELNNPEQVNPLKYGSSEVDPDPVIALLKLRDEVYAINRNTMEVFDNIGGEFFPFQRTDGAQVQKGAIGTHACCAFLDRIAFLGNGRNEPPSVYLAENGQTVKIATQEVDQVIGLFSETDLANVLLESRYINSHRLLYLHLPDRTMVYDAAASQELGSPVWYIQTSAQAGLTEFRARNMTYAYGRWFVADTQANRIGYMTSEIGSHWGSFVRWEVSTVMVYNEGSGAVFNRLELVSLPGAVALGTNPYVSTSYSVDGVIWSQPSFIQAGTTGNRTRRLVWFRQGPMRNYRIQRFQGTSDAHISFIRLEADLEPLAW